jgi:hypothetical protein
MFHFSATFSAVMPYVVVESLQSLVDHGVDHNGVVHPRAVTSGVHDIGAADIFSFAAK